MKVTNDLNYYILIITVILLQNTGYFLKLICDIMIKWFIVIIIYKLWSFFLFVKTNNNKNYKTVLSYLFILNHHDLQGL